MVQKPDKHLALEGIYFLRGIAALAAFYTLSYLPGWVMVLAIVSVIVFVTAGWVEDGLVDKINIETWKRQQEADQMWSKTDDPGMTWSCMICLAVRPDSMIDVAHRPVEGMEALFPDGARANVRYCNDRPECIAQATAPGPWRGPKKVPETR